MPAAFSYPEKQNESKDLVLLAKTVNNVALFEKKYIVFLLT